MGLVGVINETGYYFGQDIDINRQRKKSKKKTARKEGRKIKSK